MEQSVSAQDGPSHEAAAHPSPTAVIMAAPAGDDVPRQLAALLGKEAIRIRRTDENPPRVSVIDVTMAVSGGSQHDAAKSLRRLCDQYPESGC